MDDSEGKGEGELERVKRRRCEGVMAWRFDGVAVSVSVRVTVRKLDGER